MKKCLIILFISIGIFSCSSNDEDNINNPDLKVKFTLDGFHDYEGEYDEINYWETSKQSNGATKYTLFAVVDRNGVDSDESAHTSVWFGLSFIATEPLKSGQVYDIAKVDATGNFPLNNQPISQTAVCGHLSIEKDNTTSGQIKITSVSNGRISGEFYLINLHNEYYNLFISNQNRYEYSGCFQSEIPKHVNISKGEFFNVELQ